MKLTLVTREILRARKDQRSMLSQGFEKLEGPWDLDRGGRSNHRIVDVHIAADGKHLWIKTAPAPTFAEQMAGEA